MKTIYLMLIFSLLLCSCKKLVDVDNPASQLTAETVFANDKTAIAAQMAIYARMEADGLAYHHILYTGLSADEFTNYSNGVVSIDLATNNLTPENSIMLTFWTNYYKYLYQANAILEAIEKSTGMTESVKLQLKGESKFVRAFCHFYLTRLFGDIPLVSSTDYRVNSTLSRKDEAEVLSFAKEDLLEAVELLSPNYLDANNAVTTEKVRPNKAAAQALLAKVQLTREEWAEAESVATAVISSNFQLLVNLDQVFLKNSAEAIWQWQSVVPNYNSYPGAVLILTTTPSSAALDTNFVKVFPFNDNRKASWLKSITVSGKSYFFPFKYKVRQNASAITEYTTVLRLAELYLIRAEARLRQNKLPGAEEDLNTIRLRAGLASIQGITPSALLDSIQMERRFELFAEFGDRWFNLRRTSTADNIMPSVKGSNWLTTDILYPIPQTEIDRNNNLSQNPGY